MGNPTIGVAAVLYDHSAVEGYRERQLGALGRESNLTGSAIRWMSAKRAA